MTKELVLEAFKATCHHHDTSLTYPNNDYGYGEIDAEAGLAYLMDKYDGIRDVNLNANLNNEIYNLSGQRLSRPQRGINIIGGKKVLVQ